MLTWKDWKAPLDWLTCSLTNRCFRNRTPFVSVSSCLFLTLYVFILTLNTPGIWFQHKFAKQHPKVSRRGWKPSSIIRVLHIPKMTPRHYDMTPTSVGTCFPTSNMKTRVSRLISTQKNRRTINILATCDFKSQTVATRRFPNKTWYLDCNALRCYGHGDAGMTPILLYIFCPPTMEHNSISTSLENENPLPRSTSRIRKLFPSSFS